jgi:RNA 3'-terminal phosphate cyclase (ATP)/RNA 3'-terminal phosphate cyclase (GTP)
LDFVEINGGHMEGGGQIVRTAIGLSAATRRVCRIRDIRKGRGKPGLKAQHLAAVGAVAEVCGADVHGARPGSRDLTFVPGALEPPGQLMIRIGTAGAVTLAIQAVMVPLAVAGRTTEIIATGGTHVQWAPTADYFLNIFAYYLERMGVPMQVLKTKPGFYPKGGGRMHVVVSPAGLVPLQLTERGAFRKVVALSLATPELKRAKVAERQLVGAGRILSLDWESEEYTSALSPGSSIHLMAEYAQSRLGASALGERGKRADVVGVEAAGLLERWMRSGACLDTYMADQVLPYMALAGGTSRVSVADVSDHCRTNIWVIEQFLPVRFDVDEKAGLITCAPHPSQST